MKRLALLALPLFAFACKPATEAAATGAPQPPKALAVAPAAPAAPADTAPSGHAAAGEPKAHDCAAESGVATTSDKVTELKDEKTGATILAAGARLAGVPGVSIAELSQMPESWVGKTVRLEGNVSAMCIHRRGWFAVQSDDRNGGMVRVVTAPAFLVPEGSIGKRARAEGVVELIDVDPATAQHYAQEHQLPVQTKAAVVRATGAEFF